MAKYAKKSKARKSSTRSRKTTVRGSNPVGKVTANVNQQLTRSVGLPAVFKVKLRYTDHKIVTVGGPYYQQMYRLNGLYDPDASSVIVGHQPMYYDSFSNIYNEYLVTGCKVSITVTQNNSQDSPSTVFWGVKDTASISGTPSISNCMEQGDRSIMQLGFAAAGSATKSLTQYTDIAKIHGASKISPKNIPFTSVINNIPDEQVFGIVQIFSSDGISRVDCIMTITLDYTCCFFNRKQVEEN